MAYSARSKVTPDNIVIGSCTAEFLTLGVTRAVERLTTVTHLCMCVVNLP